MLFDWRNDAEARRASRNSAPIPWEAHRAWLANILNSKDHLLRIAVLNGEPVGTVRADRTKDGWEISWTVRSEARGRGLGKRMLRLFVSHLDGRLIAIIRRGHIASEKTARAAGFDRLGGPSGGAFDQWVKPYKG